MINNDRKICPTVMCRDGFVQDLTTCQCKPLMNNVSPEFSNNLTRLKGMLDELCEKVPQIVIPPLCQNRQRSNYNYPI